MDYSKLSDEELDKMVAQKLASNEKPHNYAALSDEELDKLVAEKLSKGAPKEQGLLSPFEAAKIKGTEGLLFGFRPAIAGVGGAIGSGYGTLTTPRDISLNQRLNETVRAIKEGFSESRDEANEEQKLASEQYPKLGMGAELAGNLVTAPLAPVKGIAGAAKLGALTGLGAGVSKAESLSDIPEEVASGAAFGGLLGAGGKGLEKIVGSKPVQEIGGFIKKKAGDAGASIASGLTGLSKQDIKTFAGKTDDVQKIIQNYGDDIASASDDMREKIQSQIRSYRATESNKIGQALDRSNPEKVIDINPIVEKLESFKSKLNPNYNADSIYEIEKIQKAIRDDAGETAKISLRQLHEANQYLQDQARGSYMKNGQIFQVPDKVAQAAKQTSSDVRKILNQLAPDIKEANNKLSQLHSIEKNINKNIIAPGKSDAGLMSAGSGANKRNAKMLKEISEVVGGDMLGDAQKLSAAKAFGNIPLLPVENTGKAVARMAAGYGVGRMAGGDEQGGFLGALSTSPAVLKQGLIGANAGKKILSPFLNKEAILSQIIRGRQGAKDD